MPYIFLSNIHQIQAQNDQLFQHLKSFLSNTLPFSRSVFHPCIENSLSSAVFQPSKHNPLEPINLLNIQKPLFVTQSIRVHTPHLSSISALKISALALRPDSPNFIPSAFSKRVQHPETSLKRVLLSKAITLYRIVQSVFRPFSSRIKNSLPPLPTIQSHAQLSILRFDPRNPRLESTLALRIRVMRSAFSIESRRVGFHAAAVRGEAFTLMNGRQWRRLKGTRVQSYRGRCRSRARCTLAITMKGPTRAPRHPFEKLVYAAVSLIPPANPPMMGYIDKLLVIETISKR